MLISGIDDNHHGWWIITVLGWLRTWWTPYQNGHSTPLTGIHPLEWPSREEPGSGSTASTPVPNVSAPVCTNGVWPPLRPVSVAQKNNCRPCCPPMSNPSTSSWTAWPDGSGRWDNRMASQHLPRDLVRPSSGLKELVQTKKNSCNL